MSNTSDNALNVYVGQPGLQVSYNGGNLYISGSLVTVAAGTIAVTKNTTNYIYLLFSNNTVTANTTGFPAASFPMATVVCDNERPTTLVDKRADFATPSTDQGSFVADAFTSSTASPAAAGSVRLAVSDKISWKNNAAAADISLANTGAAAAGNGNLADVLKFGSSSTGGLQAQAFVSFTSAMAQSGIVRLAAADLVAWRNAAGSGDVTLAKAGAAAAGTGNIADLLFHTAGWQGGAFVDTSAAPANSGVLRVGTGVSAVVSRNAAAGGDVILLASDASDRAVHPASIFTASVAGRASINIPAGTAPTTSVAGDYWYDSTQKSLAEGMVAGASIFKSGVVASVGAQTALTTLTTIQTAYTKALPAALLSVVGKTLRVKGAGVFTNASGSSALVTLTISVLGTAFVIATAADVITAITNGQFNFEMNFTTVSAGATGTVEAHGVLNIQKSATLTVALQTIADQITAVSGAIDLTAAGNLLIQFTSSQTLSSLTLRQASIEILN